MNAERCGGTDTAGGWSPPPHRDGGFALAEVLIAVVILAFGLLSIAAAFAQGLTQLTGSGLDVLAREKAAEAIESVFTARDTRTITWAGIRNLRGQTGADGGVFLDGPLSLTRPGADGLVNTEDDGDDIESMVTPGPDGNLGSDDDIIQPLTNFTREVEIRDLGLTLRQLRVIIRYVVGAETREYIIVTYISSYA